MRYGKGTWRGNGAKKNVEEAEKSRERCTSPESEKEDYRVIPSYNGGSTLGKVRETKTSCPTQGKGYREKRAGPI